MALKKVITGSIRKRERELSVPERHQLKVARGSMSKHCTVLAILGGPNHYQAVGIIQELTSQIVGIDAGCTCTRRE